MLRFATLFVVTAAIAPAASFLEQRIDELLRTSHALEPAAVGIEIVQLGTGKVLYSRDAGKLLTPASNTKLFSTALVLTRLGPDYRMTTRVYAGHDPDAAGCIQGDLTIVGSGDPSMSFIPIPYDKDATPADPLAAIETFADQLVLRGVRTITGDIVGDDTAYPSDPFPPGWAIDDETWEYGAPVSALTLGDNSIRVDLVPGAREGDAAVIQITPPIEYFVIENRVRTHVGKDPIPQDQALQIHRLGGSELRLSGTISSTADLVTLWLAVDDPALYTATALYDALTRRGVRISGKPVSHHRDTGVMDPAPARTLLAERASPPLLELLRVTDKVSQNLWAELMLRQVALVRTGDGSRAAGLQELKAFLTEIGVADEDYVFEDGSGLSRLTLVKPSVIVKLLRFQYALPVRDQWVSLLPVGGLDGSLGKRFHKDASAKNIHAKTGSLSHVNALSGYVDSATFGETAFSIIVNHTSAPGSEIRDFIDKIGMILIE